MRIEFRGVYYVYGYGVTKRDKDGFYLELIFHNEPVVRNFVCDGHGRKELPKWWCGTI